MSKNTGARQFRKVDVDQFDEDKYVEDTGEDSGIQGPNESEVNSLLSQNRTADALQAVLSNPPTHSTDQKLKPTLKSDFEAHVLSPATPTACKDNATALVLRVLQAFKMSDMESALNSLDRSTLDILMKYIYRGFEFPKEGVQANLLTWHEKVFAIGGYGSIIRVLTDRKRV